MCRVPCWVTEGSILTTVGRLFAVGRFHFQDRTSVIFDVDRVVSGCVSAFLTALPYEFRANFWLVCRFRRLRADLQKRAAGRQFRKTHTATTDTVMLSHVGGVQRDTRYAFTKEICARETSRILCPLLRANADAFVVSERG